MMLGNTISSYPGSTFWLIAGLIFFILGSLVATNFKGFGSWYIQLGVGLFRKNPSDEWRQKLIKRNRIKFGIFAAVGFVVVVANLVSMKY